MDDVAIKDWGVFEFIPRVGEVILAAKFLGNRIDQIGEEWRAARAYRFAVAEDTGIAP